MKEMFRITLLHRKFCTRKRLQNESLIVILPLYLLWVERKAFAGLVNRSSEQ